jgi:hypothetical protein
MGGIGQSSVLATVMTSSISIAVAIPSAVIVAIQALSNRGFSNGRSRVSESTLAFNNFRLMASRGNRAT